MCKTTSWKKYTTADLKEARVQLPQRVSYPVIWKCTQQLTSKSPEYSSPKGWTTRWSGNVHNSWPQRGQSTAPPKGELPGDLEMYTTADLKEARVQLPQRVNYLVLWECTQQLTSKRPEYSSPKGWATWWSEHVHNDK